MILLSSRKLEQALVSRKLDAWAKVKYLILSAVLSAMAGPFYIIHPWYGERQPLASVAFSLCCGLLIAYLNYRGIKRCFLENQAIDGTAFFERFAVLVMPPMLRLMAAFFVISFLIAYGGMTWTDESPAGVAWVSYVTSALGPVVTYALYAMLERSFQTLGAALRLASSAVSQ